MVFCKEKPRFHVKGGTYIQANEGPGYTGTSLDPDSDTGVGIIGYYGQAVGPFGAGQNLRAGVFF